MTSALFPLDPYADRVALIDADEGRKITYGALARCGEQLQDAIALPRALAFLFTHNGWQEVAAYLALMNAEHAVCLLDALLDDSFIDGLLKIYRPHLILGPVQRQWKGYQQIASPLSGLQVLRRIILEESPRLHPDLRLLLTTSGTTGSPKMIRLSARNILSNATAISAYLNIDSNERALASLPIHYSYGLSVLHTHLLAGATLMLTQKSVVQAEFWKSAQEYGGTSFAGVPYTYSLLDRIGFQTFTLPRLKTMTQAGGALARELVLKFHQLMLERGGRFFVMYGQTEATARMAYLPPERLPEKVGAIGKPIPGCLLKIFDGAKPITVPYQAGEIVCEGPNVMLGYASRAEDLSEGDQLKGVLRTGDLGYFDEEGLFTLTGRSKRISKVYGYRINLDEIEALLRPLGAVAVTSDDQQIFLHIEGGTPNALRPVRKTRCRQVPSPLFHI